MIVLKFLLAFMLMALIVFAVMAVCLATMIDKDPEDIIIFPTEEDNENERNNDN